MRIARTSPIGALFPIGRRSFPEADPGPSGGTGPHPKSGFVAGEQEGRLRVFRRGSREDAGFGAEGEPAEYATRIGLGPGGETLEAPDAGTIDDDLRAKENP